ncbi:bifunctional protein-serine/threonine kinase/phosphatase [Altericroceibacterium xinjiangense]|uniref:bifunctional protein-serine/threonine kinase/phosphatase n=1 Tax=Altericroceibacterium xinjiangense TaxID=762261 RepID=UPI000F7EF4EB|nr:bifunctional protein-serine/threonine kinase/phosphatase [Altericroceibacterium xinjiangense]
MRSQLAIALGQFSTAGLKPANQDFHGVVQPEGADLASKGIAVAIADGISTGTLGATAAETAVKSFLADYYCTGEAWSVRTSADRVISATNSWLHAQNRRRAGGIPSDQERERGLVCTFTALVLKGRSAHIFHVGDARIARLSGGAVEPLTEAHRVSLGGGETYLGRALGVNRNVQVDYRQFAVEPGDVFLLTTDGVHDFLPDTRLAELAARVAMEGEDLDDAAAAICAAALEAGSIDNVTVQVIRIEALPDGEVDDLIGHDVALPVPPPLRPGDEFEGYTILRELHSGARSHVYLARDSSGGTSLALKIPATERAEDADHVRALLLEEWVARRLDHPNVLRAPPVRRARRHAYAVTEYVEGQTLAEWVADNGRPDLVQLRSIVGQVAAGLLAFHRREMLHRDLRPENILIDKEGAVKIIDFGSVQVAGIDELTGHSDEAAFAGTMQFSAPELYLGAAASPQSDLFSLGVIAYWLLTSHLPYGPRVSAAGTRAAQRRLRYTPATEYNPAVPDWVDAAIAQAVSIAPERRYAELSEFTFDLAKPNSALVSPDPRPLVAQDSVRIWQAISAVLLVLLILALVRG